MALTESQKKRLDALAATAEKQAADAEPTFFEDLGPRLKRTGKRLAEDVAVAAGGAANVASFGLGGLAQRHGGALGEYLANNANWSTRDNGMTYNDFLQKITGEMEARRTENPVAHTLGSIGGAMLPQAMLARGAQGLAAGTSALAPAAKKAVGSVAGRVAGSAAVGAGQNLGMALGEGELYPEDAARLAATGAVGGAIGQGVGEVVSPIGRAVGARVFPKLAERLAKQEVAESIYNDNIGAGSLAAAVNRGKGITQPKIDAWKANMKPGGILGEADDQLLRYTQALADMPHNVGQIDDLGDLATKRLGEIDTRIQSTIMDNLVDSNRAVTGQAAKDAADQSKEAASLIFKDIFDSPQGMSAPAVSKRNMLRYARDLKDADGNNVFDWRNASSSSRAVYDRFQKEVENLGSENNMTLKGLQNLKWELDSLVRGALRGTDNSVDKMKASDLIATKNMVNDVIGKIDPRYAATSKQFGDAVNYDDMVDLGRDLLKGSANKHPLADVANYMRTLSPDQKGAVQDGAVNWLREQLKHNPNYLKKLRDGNPALMERIELIFGNAISSNATSADDIADVIRTGMAQGEAYEGMIRSVQDQPRKATLPSTDPSQSGVMTNLGAIMSQSARGQMGGTFWSRFRSLLAGHPEQTPQIALDLMKSKTPEQAQALFDELLKVKNAPNASLGWGAAGNTVTSGGHAMLGY